MDSDFHTSIGSKGKTLDRSTRPKMNIREKNSGSQIDSIQIPSISLPKGGGALKGIDEKFEVNSANGTAGYSIPLPLSPGRNDFSPTLALSYNSGSGNSPYGLGWSVRYPMIQRKTDKKLPRYRDEDGFMFSGAEDLVPYLKKIMGSGSKRSMWQVGLAGWQSRFSPFEVCKSNS